MGCLNSDENFDHWFGNIHLSGPCNRSCYFCIGQYMMALDSYNVLDMAPLPGIRRFVEECLYRDINEVNLTGTNTDPTLYRHIPGLASYLRAHIPGLKFGLRTNAVLPGFDQWEYFDKGSVTLCSFNPVVYAMMMGQGSPPDIDRVVRETESWDSLKINIVLGPENVGQDLDETIRRLVLLGVDSINLREPYGQPHVGNPLDDLMPNGFHLGMPYWDFRETRVTYWDVHYVQVESVNLYANGTVSTDYPITRGHDQSGEVHQQDHWEEPGRHQEQWLGEAVDA